MLVLKCYVHDTLCVVLVECTRQLGVSGQSSKNVHVGLGSVAREISGTLSSEQDLLIGMT